MTGSAPGRPRHVGQVWALSRRAVFDGAAAEHLAVGFELDVDFQADGRQVVHTRNGKMARKPATKDIT